MSNVLAVFSGIGTQWRGMGRELMSSNDDFAAGMAAVAERMRADIAGAATKKG